MRGNVGSSELTPEQMPVFGPKMYELNDLIGSLRPRAKMDFEDSWKTLEKLASILRTKLGSQFRIEPKVANSE